MPSKAVGSLRSGTGAGWGLKTAAAGGLLFLNLPLAFILLYALTTDDRSYTFPPPGHGDHPASGGMTPLVKMKQP